MTFKPRDALFLRNQESEVTLIYVRTTGDDSTGNGSLAAPYLTVKRALLDVPSVFKNGAYAIDCTGITESFSSDEGRFGPIQANGGPFDYAVPTLFFGLGAPLTIFATPTPVLLVTVPEIVSVTPNATTGLATIVTTLAMVPNAHKGKIITQLGFILGIVASNTATDFEVTGDGANYSATDPFEINDYGATLTFDAYGDFSAVSCSVFLEGLKLESGFGFSVFANNPGAGLYLFTHGCSIEGTFVAEGAAQGVFYFNSYLRSSYESVIPFAFNNGCFFESLTGGFNSFGIEDLSYINCIFTGCSNIGQALGGLTGLAKVRATKSLIKNSTDFGLFFAGPGNCFVESCIFNSCPSGVLSASNGAIMSVTGVPAGAGNGGVGLKVDNGSQVNVSATVLATGAGGDLKVGETATITWAAFRLLGPPINKTDVDTFSRTRQP